MKNIIHEKIIEIMKLILKINSKTEHHIFLDYSGHVNAIYVRVFLGGWAKDKKSDLYKDIHLDISSEEENITDLNSVIEDLNIVLYM